MCMHIVYIPIVNYIPANMVSCVPGIYVGRSANGWMDAELFQGWLKNHFAKSILPARPAVLLASIPQQGPQCSSRLSPQQGPQCSSRLFPQQGPQCSSRLSPQQGPQCSSRLSPSKAHSAPCVYPPSKAHSAPRVYSPSKARSAPRVYPPARPAVLLTSIPPARPAVLLADDHSTHINLEAVKIAKENQILLYCVPPHTSHATQPCDVGLFRPLKNAWKTPVNQHVCDGHQVNKYSFANIFRQA